MLADVSIAAMQTLRKQRNGLLALCVLLSVLCGALVVALAVRSERLVLVPTLPARAALSSSHVSADYLEMATRDVAYLTLNRSPAGLDYWMEEILALVHPSAYGRVKAELMQLVAEQRGSDVSQAFRLMSLRVDPKTLTSEVTGELSTIVGRQVISREKRTWRLKWSYAGFRLSLLGFEDITADGKERP